jgi:uncharacterized RDD family membrane protein YckC
MSAVDKRVGFGPRLGAYLIDGIVIGVVYYILSMVLGSIFLNMLVGNIEQMANDVQDLESAMQAMAAAAVAAMAIFFTVFGIAGSLYWILMEGMMGASVGKMALGLKIAHEDGNDFEEFWQAFPVHLGLKIAHEDGNDKGALMKRAVIKALPYLIAAVLGLALVFSKSLGLMTVLYVGYGLAQLFILIAMFMALRASKQALYDSMSGTAVFKKADVGNVSDAV